MSECVTLNVDGTLSLTGQPAETCAGYVLVSSSEFAQISGFSALFEVPAPEIASAWFAGAFGIVLICNVLGSQVGSVVKMLSSDRH
jgi:hypothetical protein